MIIPIENIEHGIHELNLSIRATNELEAVGIHTIKEFIHMNSDQLNAIAYTISFSEITTMVDNLIIEKAKPQPKFESIIDWIKCGEV